MSGRGYLLWAAPGSVEEEKYSGCKEFVKHGRNLKEED
jgi:hypothetical protein